MNLIFRNMALSTAILLAVSTPAFADIGSHRHGHDDFAPKADAHTHGTETGNVRTGDKAIEIYGKLYMSLGYSDPGVSTDGDSPPNIIQMTSHSSTLGVRGNKTLTASTRLFWQIESQIDINNLGESDHAEGGNGSVLAGSDSFVGVSCNAGTLLFGKHKTPLSMVVHDNDPFMHIPGDALYLLGRAGAHGRSAIDGGHGSMFYVRAPNSIVYMSPAISGFSTNVALIGINESTKGKGVEMPGTSLSLNFKSNGLNLAYAFEQHKNLDKEIGDHDAIPAIEDEILDKTQIHLLSAMVHFPTTMVKFSAEQLEVKDAVVGNSERTAYRMAVQQMFGLHSLRGAYTLAGSFGDHSPGAGNGAQQVAVSWFQTLSSDTQAYAVLAKTYNKEHGQYGTSVFVGEAKEGADPTTLAMGLIHLF